MKEKAQKKAKKNALPFFGITKKNDKDQDRKYQPRIVNISSSEEGKFAGPDL